MFRYAAYVGDDQYIGDELVDGSCVINKRANLSEYIIRTINYIC